MSKAILRRLNLGALSVTIAFSSAAALAAPQDADTKAADIQKESSVEFVEFKTSMGNIVLELDRARAPITVKNFLDYVNSGYYNGTIFHRVIDGFMIQGGGFDKTMTQKETKSPIRNEWKNGLKNTTGTIAMARTSNPDSASAQFFINVNDNAMLDRPTSGGAGYAVFGKVVAGMDVVDKIKASPTGTKMSPTGQPFQNVPNKLVVVSTAVEISAADAKKLIAADRKTKTPPKTIKD